MVLLKCDAVGGWGEQKDPLRRGRLEEEREIGRWRELGFQTLSCHPVNAKGVTRAGA